MRIGIDLQVLGQRPWTGVGKYAYHLAEALKKLDTPHEFVFFEPSEKHIPFFTNHWARAREMKKAKLDVLHGVTNAFPLRITNQYEYTNTKLVLTVHDLAIYKHPEWFARGQWFATKFLVPRSIKKADAIIAPSQTTKKDLMELFGVPPEKINVIPLGVESWFFSRSVIPAEAGIQDSRNWIPDLVGDDKKRKKYILFVGTLEPRKNVGRLIEAYLELPKNLRDEYDLVIAGASGWGDEIQNAKIKSQNYNSKFKSKIRILEYVENSKLPMIYQNASLFVYPSLYEGFGLPVLEAMAAGVPVVTSKESAMAEILTPSQSPPYQGGEKVGDNTRYEIPNTILMVDPYSVDEIRDAMTRVLTDQNLAHEMREREVEIAREFTWEKTARETLRVYEKLVTDNG